MMGQMVQLIRRDASQYLSVPSTVFASGFPPLVSVVAFFRQEGLAVRHIALLLQRSEKTIYDACTTKTIAFATKSGHSIPLAVLQNRSLSLMEAIVNYLHGTKGLRFAAIARIVQKDPRTIWTSWQRARRKSQ